MTNSAYEPNTRWLKKFREQEKARRICVKQNEACFCPGDSGYDVRAFARQTGRIKLKRFAI